MNHKPDSTKSVFQLLQLTVFVFFFLAGSLNSFSQDKLPITFGKVGAEDFTLPKSKVIDSNSAAVIIADVGNISFVGNKNGWVSYVYNRHTRIKIIDKKAFDLATVNVLLYINNAGDDPESLDNLAGNTYNKENGKITQTPLDKKDIYSVKRDKNHLEKKFTMPAVKEGSIIEYSYTITSDFYFNLPEWEFQNINFPCLWSEYTVAIPSLLIYSFVRQGSHPLLIDHQSESYKTYIVREQSDASMLASVENRLSVSATVINHRWVMKDIPDFRVENYISAPQNYIDKIQFQLAKTYNGETTREWSNNWKNFTQELLNTSEFGRPWKEMYADYSKEVGKIVPEESDQLEKAKKIYYYIQRNITCVDHRNFGIKTSPVDVLKKGNGDVGEVNLLLAGMLEQAGISAEPVILSTKEHGFNSPTYPTIDRFNYVVIRATIHGQVYYLDASQPLLSFGRLAENCYNGHARIISEKDSASIYFRADSIKEANSSIVFIINDEKGNGLMSGSLEYNPGYYGSYKLRKEILGSGEKEYFKSLSQKFGTDMQIDNPGIDSLQKLEEPVKLHFDFSFNTGNGQDIIYFNPMIHSPYKDNPFKATERTYPVEMPYPIDETYVLNMDIPDGFVVDEIPKSAKVAYNENEGVFEYLIQKNETSIQLRYHIKLSRANFSAYEYNSLRDFFAYIEKKESEQVVFKRKK
jgi:hypothetical protein